jgi:transposase-like protein
METGKNVFTSEFKQETLDLIARNGKPLTHVARDLGLSENTVQG